MPENQEHIFDGEGICIHCGFDGAEHHWIYHTCLRAEIGEEEYQARKQQGEFDIPCNPRR